MTAFEQAVLHSAVGIFAGICTVVLCVTGNVSGDAAIAVILAVAGISGTGIAGAAGGTGPSTSRALDRTGQVNGP